MKEIGYTKNMKIGIFGGVFDPVHNEHTKIMQKSFDELCLDKLILLPSYSPPHKKNRITSFPLRVKMLKAATKAFEFVIIDEREYYSTKENNCAFEILQSICNDYTNDELIYIIGGDSMQNFHTWVNPALVASLVSIAVVAREGYEDLSIAIEYAKCKYDARIRLLSFVGEEVSSSLIKASFELGKKSEVVAQEVSDIISEEKLYRLFSKTVQQLKNSITDELFEHCVGTVLYAMKFVSKLNLNYDEVFLAALLHDCAKQTSQKNKYKEIPSKIVHQFAGADMAYEIFGIENEDILDAIRYHTTGKKGMSNLGKLIYCADMVEQNREFEGVEQLREALEKDFCKGFVKCIDSSIQSLKKRDRDIYYLTKECWEYYNNSV